MSGNDEFRIRLTIAGIVNLALPVRHRGPSPEYDI